jgi:hypothetical protein
MHTVKTHISRRCRPFIASAVLVPALLLALSAYTPAASGSKTATAQLTQTRSLGRLAAVRPSYGWPLKPFNRQHPVRAYLNDPRNGHGDAKSFHFGIDVSGANGTPVYAVEAGQVFITRGRMAVAVKGAARTFGYWHVMPAVRNHQIVRLHQLLGYICSMDGGGAHVHLAERRNDNGEYVNPLRPGGIGPYVDRTPPTVASVQFLSHGQELAPDGLSGRVQVIVDAFDTTPMLVSAPWSNMPVTPARIRWSIMHGSRSVVALQTAADFSKTMLPAKLYDSIYAPGTVQNFVGAPGHYRFYLTHGLVASRLPAGVSRLRIEATDTRGNRVVASVEISKAAI